MQRNILKNTKQQKVHIIHEYKKPHSEGKRNIACIDNIIMMVRIFP